MREMVGGSGTLRFFIQPAIAILLGVLHGLRDRRVGSEPSLPAIARRTGHLRQGLRALELPLVVAVMASWLFQYLNRGHIHLLLGFIYALVFVLIPYIAARDLSNRASRRRTIPD
jgi:hypothetical protein